MHEEGKQAMIDILERIAEDQSKKWTTNPNHHSHHMKTSAETNENESSVEEQKSYWEQLREELRQDPKNL